MVGLRRNLLGLASAWLFCACQEVPRTYSTQGPMPVIFSDDFARDEVGQNWRVTGGEVSIVDGALEIENLRNHPLWLQIPLPESFVLEFDAWALDDNIDVKVEVAGDGRSVARTTSYQATGYVLILGGWENSLDVIARQDEHGSDRISRATLGVAARRKLHFTLIRRGRQLQWLLDARPHLTYVDDNPLVGIQHQFFAFGGWQTRVRFDNLVIRDARIQQASADDP